MNLRASSGVALGSAADGQRGEGSSEARERANLHALTLASDRDFAAGDLAGAARPC